VLAHATFISSHEMAKILHELSTASEIVFAGLFLLLFIYNTAANFSIVVKFENIGVDGMRYIDDEITPS